MRKILNSLLIVGCFLIAGTMYASDGVCIKCEKNREYNRTHPSKYVYYEDYLKDQEESQDNQEPPELDKQQNTVPKPESKKQNK